MTKSWLKITPGLGSGGDVGWRFLDVEVFQQVKREMVSALAITVTSFHAWQSSEIVAINALLTC